MEKIRKRISACFPNIKLNELTHKYYIADMEVKISVSGIVKKFVRKVDFGAIAKRKDAKEGLPPGTYQKQWDLKRDNSCARGNEAHYFGEDYTFDRTLSPKNGLQEAIAKFWAELPDHIVPVFSELMMYTIPENKICPDVFAGTADIILYNTKTEKFIIADYKTNEQLFKNFADKKLLGVFSDLLETNFNKYQIQFSNYQLLFEQTGFEVSHRKLVWLKDDGTYEMYDTTDYTKKLKTYLKRTKL
jgi:hypothetical protein